MLEAVDSFYHSLKQSVIENEDLLNIRGLLWNLPAYDLTKIFLKNDTSISAISNHLFGDWSYISRALQERYDSENAGKSKQKASYEEKKEKMLAKVKAYSIGELNTVAEKFLRHAGHIEEYFEDRVTEILEKLHCAYESCVILHNRELLKRKSLNQNRQAVTELKYLLDAVKELQRLLKPLMVGQEEAVKDEVFYAELLRIWEDLDPVTPLYNKVRNYVTKKQYSLEKIKLNFYK